MSGPENDEPDADAGGLAGFPGMPDIAAMPDLGDLMGGLARMQELQDATYEGVAGGGAVRIRADGRLDVESVTIDPAVLEPPDAELLADLVHAALRDLVTKIGEAQRDAIGPLGGMFGSP